MMVPDEASMAIAIGQTRLNQTKPNPPDSHIPNWIEKKVPVATAVQFVVQEWYEKKSAARFWEQSLHHLNRECGDQCSLIQG